VITSQLTVAELKIDVQNTPEFFSIAQLFSDSKDKTQSAIKEFGR